MHVYIAFINASFNLHLLLDKRSHVTILERETRHGQREGGWEEIMRTTAKTMNNI